ncbi:hypothetical protein L1049_010043 [Liquidambar formosana]|uniref:FCP1 homology domain-containing protein n=1 Tax=Liquidambar formosana TaxID=63359 RepID=A0AAP0R1F1_LIQFO
MCPNQDCGKYHKYRSNAIIKNEDQVMQGLYRGKNCLSVCPKSTIISKNSCSRVTTSQQTAEFDNCIQNCQDVSLSTEVSTKDIRSDEANDHQELLDVEDLQLQKHTLFFVDSAIMGRMEFTPAVCPSNLESIFSPVLESIEVHTDPDVHSDAVNNNDPDLPQLRADDSNDNSRSSYDYQTCNVSDFFISDMVVTGLPFDGNTLYDDFTESIPCSDYECAEPSMLFDVAERYMILPFLEDTVETSNTHNENSGEEAIMALDNSSLYLAFEMKSCDQDSNVNSFSDLDQTECFDPHLFIKNLPDLSDMESNCQPPVLPKQMWKRKPITLALDLDETLVHSTLEHCDDADFTFPVFFNMKEHTVYVKQRPFLRTFLERVAEMFEVVVFTASQSIYAAKLLDILDPDGNLISQRFYRESCIFSDGSYTKDLTVLGVDLAKVAIIDNSPQVILLPISLDSFSLVSFVASITFILIRIQCCYLFHGERWICEINVCWTVMSYENWLCCLFHSL